MSPVSLGPVKAMVLSLDAERLGERMRELLAAPGATGSLRETLQQYAEVNSIEI